MSGRHTVNQAIRMALAQRGTPYVWGGSAPGGFDCSGLVYWAYRQAGYTGIGRTTYDQIKQGVQVSAGQLRPGDIVFPSTHHEGLYIGNGQVLEAPHTGDKVKIIPLSSFGFLTARRLIAGGGGVVPPRAIAGQHPGTGLPLPSPNPADRTPHPDAHAAAALIALLGQHDTPLPRPALNLPKPGDVFAKLAGQPSPAAQLPSTGQAQMPGTPLQTAASSPVRLLQVPQTQGPSQANLDSIRNRLLGVQ